MERADLLDAITAHRLALADQLADLTPDQWDAPSLCEGWRTREVLAHLLSILELPRRRFIIGVFGMRGFNRRVDEIARELGQREPEDMLGAYRRLASRRIAPPGIGPIAPLTDVVVHSLDIERPTGLPEIHTPAVAGEILDRLSRGLPGFTPKSLVNGLHFEATDLGWAGGEGPKVEGRAADLILALSSRPIGVAGLSGEGAGELRRRILGRTT